MKPTSAPTRPRVGISASRGCVLIGDEPLWSSYSPVPYETAVLAAGGLPLALPWASEALMSELCGELDALILSGGCDLGPGHYGEEPHPQTGESDPERDAHELALALYSLERGLPLLGICRGVQVLNVALGGTLRQHLPQTEVGVRHYPFSVPDERRVHSVELAASSRLAAIAGTRQLEVNSTHHQAVSLLGDGLIAVGWAPDGVIEAVEHLDEGMFVFGVQWHAETLAPVDAAQERLLEALVAAGGEFRRRRLESRHALALEAGRASAVHAADEPEATQH